MLGLSYVYCNGCNNGNVLYQGITRSSAPDRLASWTQSYSYDAVNRLAGASETGSGSWSQTFSYDACGNRWVTANGLTAKTPNNSAWYDPSTNHINGWGYDAAGNVTQVGVMARSFTCDAENRQATAAVAGGWATYGYDGEGRRVTKTAAGQTTVFVYDALGSLAAEYGPAIETGTVYYTPDALGSTRLKTAGSNTGPVVVRSYDYMPFGEELGSGIAGRDATFPSGSYPSPVAEERTRFTGKERDGESGLDYFQYRYLSSAQGRWTSPDPLPGWPEDPQSWNRYSYGRNNPLKYVDPLGLSYQVCDENGKNCTKKDVSDQQFADFKKQNKGEIFANGKIYYKNETGSTVQIGTYKRTGDDISNRGVQVLIGLEQRADASNKLIATVAAGSAVVGVAGGALVGLTGLSSGGLTTLTTGGEQSESKV